MSIRCILWDFDGVILDSMSVRDLGFVRVLSGFSDADVQKLLIYHRENGGLSRYHKFRYFFEKILGREISIDEVNEYAASFSKIMKELLVDPKNLIEDAVGFIRNNHLQYEFHIVSGSDQEELRYLCSQLNISQYFKSISGSPTPKTRIVKDLISTLPFDLSEICLIGDSKNDAEAALLNHIAFYGYNNPVLKETSQGYIESFSKIKQFQCR